MAPRPKTYGARRSHAKPVGEQMNGTRADESEDTLRKFDVMSMLIRKGQEKRLATAPREEKQNILSQSLKKEDGLASGTTAGESTASEGTPGLEDMSKPVSPAPWSLQNRTMSAQDMLPPQTRVKEHGSRRKSTRKPTDGSKPLLNQNLSTEKGSGSMPIGHAFPSHAKATFRPNGVTENHQYSPVAHDIDLNDGPSDLHNMGVWVAQLIRKCHQTKVPLSVISEPRQEELRLEPGHDIGMSDALENLEDVRMTRGKAKKRLQQLKGKELANGNGMSPPLSCYYIASVLAGYSNKSELEKAADIIVTKADLSNKFITGSGRSLRLKDAAPVERLLKANLNDQLRQRLFGCSDTTDVSANVTERDACGTLLFNTLVHMGDSANNNSATVLNSALNERKDNAPFLSALNILASSSEVMAFINFCFSKANGRLFELPRPTASRPSTGEDVTGSETITELSGLPSHAGTSVSNSQGSLKTMTDNKAMDNKNIEQQKRSDEVIQAFEAATTVLVQIQQGEAGAGYITPYASGSMFFNPVGQGHFATYCTAYGPPLSNPTGHGMVYGPPVGANLSNYGSPFVTPLAPHPNSYASPYPNPVDQPPANYASPYPMVPNEASNTSLIGSGNNNANNCDGLEVQHGNEEAHTSNPDVTGTVAKKGNDEAAGQHVGNEDTVTRMPRKEADEPRVGNGNEESSKAYDEANPQATSNEREVVGNVVEMDNTKIGDLKPQESGNEDHETGSDEDLTEDDLPVVKLIDKNATPPAENHKLFTGERLGDFSSVEKIDWLLTIGNGGKMPTPRKKRTTRSPSRGPPSQADDKVYTEVCKIIDEIMLYKGRLGHPGATTKQLFYASAEGQRLAAELGRLMAIAKPVVNTILPLAESEARLRFYQQLESRAIQEKRVREVQGDINRFNGAPVQIQQWVPPPGTLPIVQFPIPAQLPSNGPTEVPFVRRGNVIAAPPGGRNIEEEKKAETYGYPPMPGSRPGDSQQGQKRKRSGRH